VAEPDTRQLPQSTTPAASQPAGTSAMSTEEQVEQLQRQLDELKRQQAAQQAQKNAG